MATFHLQIVTPDGVFFDGDAARVTVRAAGGDVTVLPRHIDYVTALGMGEARITAPDGAVRRAACMGGLLAVAGGEVRLVATTFEWADQIDENRALRAKEEAERRLAGPDADALAEARLRRALTRLRVLE